MPEHIKIILPRDPVSASALMRIQGELGLSIGALEAKIAAGEPILDRLPPHTMEEAFLKSTSGLVHILDNIGLDYRVWYNGEPVTPQRLRTLLTHKLHVRQNLRGPKAPRSRFSPGED